MKRRAASPLCLAFLLLAAPTLLFGQSKDDNTGNTIIRTTVRRVVVDVAVTDLNGQPVRGLTRADFTVHENGVRQRILSFEPHDQDTDTFTPTAAPNLPPNSFVNLPPEPERGPLYVLLYDMANTGLEQQIVSRRKLVKFMESKPAGTRFAFLVFSDGLHLVQGFTNDPRKLQAALDVHTRHPHFPLNFLHGEDFGAHNTLATLSMLEDIRHYVEGLPGRKNLIWVSDQFPLALFSPAPPELVDKVKRELAALAKQQIAIYPVDDRGVFGGMIALEQYALEDEIAHITGGHAIYSNNDLVDALTQATESGASYYTLSYNPTNAKEDGKQRRISLKVDHHAVLLSYRREYWADRTDSSGPAPDAPLGPDEGPSNQPPTPEDTLYTDMRHGWPMSHDLLFGAHVQLVGTPKLATPEQMAELVPDPIYFKSRRKNRQPKPRDPITLQTYQIDYNVPARQLKPGAPRLNKPTGTLEFAAAAYNSEEVLLNGAINHATPDPATTAETAQAGNYHIQQELLAPLGAAWIRVAVRDADTGRIGSLEVALPLAPTPSTTAEQTLHPVTPAAVP
jgi:VWFA-related protein